MDVFFSLLTPVVIAVGIRYATRTISKELGNIMSAIDTLRDAVNNQTTTFEAALTAMETALTELAEDIRGLAGSEDVEAEAARIATNTDNLSAALGGFAQRVHDAIPTDAPEDPLPPVEEPIEDPAEEEEPVEGDPVPEP